MTKEELASLLNGREYGKEITKEEERLATNNGLIVAFGASDDILELRGSIHINIHAWEGGSYQVYKKGDKIPHPENKGYFKIADKPNIVGIPDLINDGCLNRKLGKPNNRIDAIWCPVDEEGNTRMSWLIETDIPHATFEIMEDEELFCQGIVFSVNDIKTSSSHNYTSEEQEKVCEIVHKWMVKHNCHSAEHAAQNDECTVYAIDLVCDLAEIVGIPYKDEND